MSLFVPCPPHLDGGQNGGYGCEAAPVVPQEGDAARRDFQTSAPIFRHYRSCIERASARLKAGACGMNRTQPDKPGQSIASKPDRTGHPPLGGVRVRPGDGVFH